MSGGGDAEEGEPVLRQRGCCYLWAPCFGSMGAAGARSAAGGRRWERINPPEELEPRWWRRALLTVREWSELLAGPRWKTFIRRVSRSHRGGGGAAKTAKHQYDPLSYALNFDDGAAAAAGEPDGDRAYIDFSSRFVRPPPPPPKTSVDAVIVVF